MRRSNLFSTVSSALKVSFASALALAFVISCTDSTGPLRFPSSAHSMSVYVPDSVKNYWLEADAADLSAAPDVSYAPGRASLSASAVAWKYSISHPEKFEPEEYPRIAVPREMWFDPKYPNDPAHAGDGYITDVPIGFEFTFYGNTYDKLNINANGFVSFGEAQIDITGAGFFKGGLIPSTALPNNMIAFAWTDWSPDRVDNGVLFETRGTAPRRRFLLQFNNVPEFFKGGTGVLMMQLVLEEGTNVITIWTNTMSVNKNSLQKITQGIENADGTAARFDNIVSSTGVSSPRVRNFFSLANDAVRFTPPRPPVVTVPPSLSIQPSTGSCLAASVNVGTATATDDIGVVSLVGVRSDDPSLALDAPYPSGVTTITWTATDTDGMTDSKSQTVTVSDKESPTITPPTAIERFNDWRLPSAVIAVAPPEVKDNCSDVDISSSRSDGALPDAPFMVGVTTITWKATDKSGNTSSADQLITVRDNEPPRMVVPPDAIVNATSITGAVVSYADKLQTADNVGVVWIDCTKASGTGFPMGDTRVECTVSDAAGNSVKGSFLVTVLNAQLQMQNLLDYLYGLSSPNGGTNPLANQVSAALNASLTDNHVACVKMNDFISMAAKKARDFPSGSISFMTDEATRIIAVLGCSTSRSRG